MRAALLLAGMAGLAWGTAPPAKPTPEQAKHLRERPWFQTTPKTLEIELRVYGPWHRLVERTAEELAVQEAAAARWEQELQYRRVIVESRRVLDGERHWNTDDARRDLAEASAQKKRTQAQRDALDQALGLHAQALQLYHAGQPSRALPLARKALALRKPVLGERHPLYATTLHNVAANLSALGDHKAALPLFQQALALRKDLLGERHPSCGNTLDNLASLHQDMGDHKSALPLFKQSLAIIREARGVRHPDYALCLNNLGALYMAMGDHQAALSLLEQALVIKKEVMGARHPEYATALNNLALLRRNMGDIRGALPMIQEALEIIKEVQGEGHPNYAASLTLLAVLHRDVGDLKAAIPLLKKALVLTEEGHPHYAHCLNNLAALYTDIGDRAAALSLHEKALALNRRRLGGRHPAVAISLNNLGLLLKEMGDYKSASAMHEEALAIRARALGKRHPDYAISLNNLALLHHDRGDAAAALPLFKEALSITRDVHGIRHPHYANALHNLAGTLADVGDHKKALPLLQEALEITRRSRGEKHRDYASVLHSLATLHRAMGDPGKALPLVEQVRAIFKESLGERHPLYAQTLQNLAVLHLDVGDPKAALPLTEQALALTAAHLRDYASVQSDRQQLAAAADVRGHLDTRLLLPDDPGGSGDVSPPGSKKHLSAATHVLAWKGSLLLRQIERRLFLRLASDPAARRESERLRSVTRELAFLRYSPDATRSRLDPLEKEQEQAQARLSRLSAAFGAARERQNVTPEALAKALPEGAALVDYLFYSDKLVAFVHRRGKTPARVELGKAAPAALAVQEWRALLVAGKPEGHAGAALKKLALAPLEKHLGGADTLLISPDGVLGLVPFAALPGKKEGTYLIEDVALAVVPVPSTCPDLLLPARGRPEPSLLAVGGLRYEPLKGGAAPPAGADTRPAPRHGRGTFAPLAATRAETDAVELSFKRLFKGGAVTSLSAGDANKAAVRKALASVRYAHLATHGFFAPEEVKSALHAAGRKGRLREHGEGDGWHPLLLSGLALSDANRTPREGEEDGILTALEVSEMDLSNLEMAVLSACETGLGKVAGGEGILGLQRAFQVAGARSVVASLWQVDDVATWQLMQDFYGQTWDVKRPVGKAEALRKAQLAMLFGKTLAGKPRAVGKVPEKVPVGDGKRVHPYYWAGFVLSGDWR